MDGSGGKNASVEAIASKNVTFIIRVVLDTDFEAGGYRILGFPVVDEYRISGCISGF